MSEPGTDSCRSFIGKCLKAAQDDASVVLGAIDDAHRNRVADAPAWISARLKAPSHSPTVKSENVDWDAICVSYKKFGHWSKHAPGNSPDSSSCQCPPEILAKHGITTQAARDPPPAPAMRTMQ
jgi:hypothetical protein